jgi:hypothetical protein
MGMIVKGEPAIMRIHFVKNAESACKELSGY